MSKYIEIIELPSQSDIPKKTKKWYMRNKRDDSYCGVIKWYGGWRKYVFYPANDSLYDWECLRMAADFCEVATKEHKS